MSFDKIHLKFEGTWENDSTFDIGSVITQNRHVTIGGRDRDTEISISFGHIMVTISCAKLGMAGLLRCKV
jgi:hypothetical protein